MICQGIAVEVVISPAATDRIIGIDATGLLVVDEGTEIDVSDQAPW